MRDIAAELSAWLATGRRFALATVVATGGSAPRPPGTTMAVDAGGEVLGSLSGGCVESEVAAVAQQVLDGAPSQLLRFEAGGESALPARLACGGVIEVLVAAAQGAAPALAAVLQGFADDRPIALATVLAGPAMAGAALAVSFTDRAGDLGSAGLDAAVRDDARGLLASGDDAVRRYGPNGERRRDDVTVFVKSFAPRPRMIVFGAIDFAAGVSRMGAFLGFRVTVCDARAAFATAARFPDADEVVVAWPHRYLEGTAVDAGTVLCVLTHDPKFDIPLLESALRTRAAYIGVMGSRALHADRLDRLRERGVGEAALGRLRAPIGLDLGARTPAETAVSIAAEIVAARWSASGLPLRDIRGPIHPQRPPAGKTAELQRPGTAGGSRRTSVERAAR